MWIGRNLAEIETGEYGVFATLTYGRSDRMYEEYRPVGADIFCPDDYRGYLMRVRKHIVTDWKQAKRSEEGRREYCRINGQAVFPPAPTLRTFVVGERGESKGQRCHWHLLMYFKGCRGPVGLPMDRYCFHGKYPPEVMAGVNVNIIEPGKLRWDFRRGSGIDWQQSDRTFWPYGMVKYSAMDPRHPFYVCDYIVEDQNAGIETARPSQSRRPILGAAYFEDLARQHVEQGLSPQERTFKLPRNYGYEGPMSSYWLGRSSARVFALKFIELWAEAHAADPVRYSEQPPRSDFLDKILEEEADRQYEKQNRGKPEVYDELREEFAEAIRKERMALKAKRPGDIGAYGPLKGEAEADPERSAAEYAQALSQSALRKLADASWSESRRLKRIAIKRHRKINSAVKRGREAA